MSKLPRGWVEATIRDLCELINGKAFKPSDWTTEGLPIVRIQNLNNPNSTFNYYQGFVEEKFLIEDGQLLFAWSGTPGTSFGAHVWNGGRAVLNQHIFKVNFPLDLINKHFLRNAINQKLEELIGKAHGGAGLQHVTKGKFEETLISLPPLAEQKRIVAKVDALNARSARARTELARIETLVSRYKQAVLSKAFSGELTREWKRLSLGDALKEAQIGLVRSKEQQFASGGTPYVRMNHFDLEGRWHLDDITHVEASPTELQQFALQTGDVLFNTRNSFELVGKVAYWEGRQGTFLYNNNILRMRFEESIASKFAFFQMQSAPFRTYLQSVKSATTSVCAIYQKALAQAPFVVPKSLPEQHEIVRRIESAFAKIDRLARDAKRALELVGKLDEAILAKAFRGELVPQDENDEPAELLLDRIRAEREKAPKAKRGRRTNA